VDDQRPYEALLYPFFLQQEKGGARAPFLATWKTKAGARNPAAFDDHLNGTFGFAEHCRDFTVRNFDDTTRLPPSAPRYQAQDAAIPPNERPHVIEPATR
jgi:hypothetical protein